MQRNILAPSMLLMLLNRCYAVLLYAYPTYFRRTYGAGMAQVFRDETRMLLQEGHTAVLLQFLLQTTFDLTKTVRVEQPLDPNWKLISPKEPAEKTRDRYRFAVKVEPGKPAVLEVNEDAGREPAYGAVKPG